MIARLLSFWDFDSNEKSIDSFVLVWWKKSVGEERWSGDIPHVAVRALFALNLNRFQFQSTAVTRTLLSILVISPKDRLHCSSRCHLHRAGVEPGKVERPKQAFNLVWKAVTDARPSAPITRRAPSPFQMDCPAALERIKEGRPITIRDDKGNTSKCIADIVSVSRRLRAWRSFSSGGKKCSPVVVPISTEWKKLGCA